MSGTRVAQAKLVYACLDCSHTCTDIERRMVAEHMVENHGSGTWSWTMLRFLVVNHSAAERSQGTRCAGDL